MVTFDLGGYWGAYYRNRPFYADRARWGGGSPYGEGATNRGAFYNRLAPYGNWMWLQGQYVWVPQNVGPAWRPYTVGRRVYTDRYGWMWTSNEPFGWATYHYHRWGFSNRVGWFWVPGNRWAPAWVSWRSSNDYLAWAPLPPAYDEGVSIEVNVAACRTITGRSCPIATSCPTICRGGSCATEIASIRSCARRSLWAT